MPWLLLKDGLDKVEASALCAVTTFRAIIDLRIVTVTVAPD